MGKRRAAIPGLDYVPVPGKDPNFVFGVVRTSLAGETNTATGAILKRLFPVRPPPDAPGRFITPTTYRFDVTLPDWAPTDYMEPLVMARGYDDQAWDGLKDLVVMMNFRFPEAVIEPPAITLHAAFELVRSFALQRLSRERDMATVIAMHVPSRAGQQGVPHIHVMAPARKCLSTGFGEFVRTLATDAGREIIEAEFAEWRAQHEAG